MKQRSMLLASLVAISSPAIAEVDAKFYGFIKAGVMSSDKAVNSFGTDSMTAPTEARNFPESGPSYELERRTSLQTAQSRFGWKISNGPKTSGLLELDMVNFTQSAPTTTGLRVRRASLSYKVSEQGTWRVGKDLILFNAVFPMTYNYVSGFYRSGNSGFMGDEIAYLHKFGSIEAGASIGNHGRNLNAISSTSTDIPTEFSTPAYTLRVEHQGDVGRMGIAYITGETKWSSKDSSLEDAKAHAAKIYADLNLNKTNLKVAAYSGKNPDDLALLTLARSNLGASSARTTEDLGETGYILTVSQKVSDFQTVHLGYGAAAIDNVEDGVAANTLVENSSTRVGYRHQYDEGLSAYVEWTQFESNYLATANTTDTNSKKASLLDVGLLFNF